MGGDAYELVPWGRSTPNIFIEFYLQPVLKTQGKLSTEKLSCLEITSFHVDPDQTQSTVSGHNVKVAVQAGSETRFSIPSSSGRVAERTPPR